MRVSTAQSTPGRFGHSIFAPPSAGVPAVPDYKLRYDPTAPCHDRASRGRACTDEARTPAEDRAVIPIPPRRVGRLLRVAVGRTATAPRSVCTRSYDAGPAHPYKLLLQNELATTVEIGRELLFQRPPRTS